MRRTPDIDVGVEFQVDVPITKAYVDRKTGKRHIVGVASGVAQDRDGERVSKRGVLGMVRDVMGGDVKLTSSHQQDWMTEIGDVAKAEHDPETDELLVDTVLPPEGVDPIADKAWVTANREKVGFSVGGKLLKSFFERDELGKKRKVLDAIKLRHIMLTKSPSYPHSFAEAVAKTWDGEAPADDEFTLDADDVEKGMATGGWASGDSDSGGGNVGRDSVGSGQRNAGSKDPKSKGMSTEEDGSNDDDDDDKELPKASDERHLACPNCGHEFAADLPLDPEERQVDETGDDNEPDNDQDKPHTGKSATKEDLMSTLTETLDALKALAAADDVTKTTTEPAEPVAKTETGPTDVEKMVAASHKAHEDAIEKMRGDVSEAFELIAKSHKAIIDRLEGMPVGRKSVARVLPSAVGHESEGGEVAKSTEQQIAEAPDAVTALKIQNRATYGVE